MVYWGVKLIDMLSMEFEEFSGWTADDRWGNTLSVVTIQPFVVDLCVFDVW